MRSFCFYDSRDMIRLTRALLAGTLVIALPVSAQISAGLRPYTRCTFDDGLAVSNLSPLPPGVQGRTVATLTGPRPVPLLRGETVMFSYPQSEFYANVKVEQLPAPAFAQGKKDLISNFDHILAGGNDSTRNLAFALHPQLNGFETYGLDRTELAGATLGIYLLIDNRTHIVATVYFLNQDPARRKFSTLAEYAVLRDHFLTAYTSCVHAAVPAAKPKASPATKPHR